MTWFRVPRSRDAWIAFGLFAATFLTLFLTQSAVGFVRDESVYFVAGDSYARWFRLLWVNPSQAVTDAAIVRFFDVNHEHPALMKMLFGLSSLIFHDTLGWLKPAAAARLPAFAASALIPSFTYFLGTAVYGRRVGFFAAVSFFLVPRQFFNAHLACFDIPITAVWLGSIYFFWRALRHSKAWLVCGVVFGIALATKHNALFLPFVLFPLGWLKARGATEPDTQARAWVWGFLGVQVASATLYVFLWGIWGEARFIETFAPLSPQVALFVLTLLAGGSFVVRLRGQSPSAFRPLAALVAMQLAGPVLFYLLWPYLWHHPIERTVWYLRFHAQHNHYPWFYLGRLLRAPPFPLEYVVVVTALTVPVSLFVPMTFGFLSSTARAVAQLGRRWVRTTAHFRFEELLIWVNALVPIAIISHPEVPHFGGVKHWFPAMPFLALLGGVSVVRAADFLTEQFRKLWPQVRLGWATAALFGLLWLPALWASVRIHPYGTSHYSELAGGLPGAASLGMQRQFWSSNVTGVLPWLNAHAPQGARIWLHEVTYYAFRQYQQNGFLRRDLQPAGGPEGADFAAYQYHQEFREQEMSIWQAFNTTTPSYGLYLDETPQVVVYQRR